MNSLILPLIAVMALAMGLVWRLYTLKKAFSLKEGTLLNEQYAIEASRLKALKTAVKLFKELNLSKDEICYLKNETRYLHQKWGEAITLMEESENDLRYAERDAKAIELIAQEAIEVIRKNNFMPEDLGFDPGLN